jgi:molybdopterin converting factor small subunit
MKIRVLFHSYFKELTGCSETSVEVADATTLGNLVQRLQETFPKLKPMQRSTLMAVGVEYQPPDYQLQEGDEVSLFPPVQGG